MSVIELRWHTLVVFLLLFAPIALSGQASKARPDRQVHFTDVTVAAKIDFVHESGSSPEKYMVETFGSGVAWIDYDNDGRPDLYFVNGAPGAANVLYRNNGDGTFEDVTQQAGVAAMGNKSAYKTGVAVGDFDNDAHLDLYITAFGPNILYRNKGDGSFTEVTAAAAVSGGPAEWSSSAGFFDADRDGDLDLYVANYLDYRLDDNPYCGFKKKGYRMYCSPVMFDGAADRLFLNNGDGTFADASSRAGIANPAGKGLGVAFCDYDGDGLVDIYVANDLVRNFLYRNNGDGTFRDVAYGAGVGFDVNGKPQAGMGVDCADVNGNGQPDIFVTNFSDELNTLYDNRGDGLFEDVSAQTGLGSGLLPLGFGTKLFDADNDGDLDAYVTNGHIIDNVELYHPTFTYAQQDLLYENVDGSFLDVSHESGSALEMERVGRGLAVSDFDNDGNLDVVISNLGQPPMLLKSQGIEGRNWIMVRAQGRKSNAFGLGARVRLETSDDVQVREINNVASYLSSNDVRLHFGLGQAKTIRRIEILWPSGVTQVLKDVAANQVLVIKEPSGSGETRSFD
jgi:hypothetical protein